MRQPGQARLFPSREPRDAYERVGRSLRESIDRAVATAEGRELTRLARVLLAAYSFTASYSRLSDTVYLAQLCDVAKIAGDVELKHTADALKVLNERRVLIYEPSKTPGRPSWIQLPDAGLGGRPSQPPLVNVPSGSPSSSSRTSSEGEPLRHRNGDPSGSPLQIVETCLRCDRQFRCDDPDAVFCPACQRSA